MTLADKNVSTNRPFDETEEKLFEGINLISSITTVNLQVKMY